MVPGYAEQRYLREEQGGWVGVRLRAVTGAGLWKR